MRWIILAGAVVLAVVIAGTVFALSRPTQSGQPAPTLTAVATPSPSSTPTPTVSDTPTPTLTPTPSKVQTPYCKAFSRITDGGIAADGGDGSVDFKALSAQFGKLITRYSAAAALAPASLAADYAKVLKSLKQGKAAVDAKDLNELKVMVGNLGSLNDTMTNIQAESKTLCG